jgi:hypothetical protein
MWHHFKVFYHETHPDMKGCIACILCFEAKNYDCGTICAKGGNTSGFIRHMKTHHIKHYNETMKGSSLESNTNGCQDITLIFHPQEKQRYLGIGDAKELFKTAIASWMIDKGMQFLEVEEKTFRKMFEPLNKKAPKIVNVDRKSTCEVVMLHGRLAKEATQIELEGQEVAWTKNHWTGQKMIRHTQQQPRISSTPIGVMYPASLISKSSWAPPQVKLYIMILRMCCRSFRATT